MLLPTIRLSYWLRLGWKSANAERSPGPALGFATAISAISTLP